MQTVANGPFANANFAGFTLNTMTFGGLALGIGMIVDASIVVLENTFRHMEHGKDRMQAAIDASEEVWSAILASTLTHIAVFIPLLFLSGVSSILFKQLSIVVMFSLTMSLFVAVTIVPVLCSRLLKLPPPREERRGLTGRLYTMSERFLDGMDEKYSRLIHKALVHRPTVIGVGVTAVVVAVLVLPTIGFELMPATDVQGTSATTNNMGTADGCINCHGNHHNDPRLTLCGNCHTTTHFIPSTFVHPQEGPHVPKGEQPLPCVACHQTTFSQSYCSCHGGKPPTGGG